MLPNKIVLDAIIYDWNGTLIDDVSACHSILNGLLSRYDLSPVSFETYRDVFTFPVIEYYKKVGFELDKYSFEEVASHFKPMYDEAFLSCKLYDGVVKTLSWAKNNGIKQYLLSATQMDSLLSQVEYFNITKYFDKIVGTDNFHGKSKIEEGRALVESENLKGKRFVLIGDTDYDASVACSLGAECMLVDFGHKPRKFLEDFGEVFSSWEEIIKKLEFVR